jgi:hypothetical protein
MGDIGTVGGLVEYLKSLPQDAAVYIADGQSYRFVEDYPDWDERENASFPIEAVTFREGLTGEEQDAQFNEAQEARKARGLRPTIRNPEMLPPSVDEPEKIVTLLGCR